METVDESRTRNREAVMRAVEAKVREIQEYVPKVGVFGHTGAGKSHLCNALFGEDVAEVSDVEACTRSAQEILLGQGNGGAGIVLVDVPGVGESRERDDEYFGLYEGMMPSTDLVLWVIKADNRALATDIEVYQKILKPHTDRCPVIFVLNQVDKVEPFREWNEEQGVPGPKQAYNIDRKVLDVAKAFDVSPNSICAVSAVEGYNLATLVEVVVKALPKEKKYAFVREAKESVVNEASAAEAERGLWDTVKEVAGHMWDSVKDDVMKAATSLAVKGVKSLLKRWF